jgi:hypothetical protein
MGAVEGAVVGASRSTIGAAMTGRQAQPTDKTASAAAPRGMLLEAIVASLNIR